MCSKKIIVKIGIVQGMIIMFLSIMIYVRPNMELDVDLSQWQSRYISFMDNVWAVSEGEIQEQNVDLIYGPYVNATRGGYSVRVHYNCEENQRLQIYANTGKMAYVRANAITLSKNRTFVSYDFELTEDIDNLEIVVKYNGKGDFKINNISIKENNNILKRRLVYLFFIFIMLDVMYFFNRKIRTNKKIILIILGITFCISLPLFYRGMNIGHDGMFHQVRIDGIAEELSYGNFPVRIQSLWMEGYGYPISVYYGDILLYIPALLRLMGFSVTQCFKFYILMINIGTVVCSYWGFKKIFGKIDVSLTLTFIYTTASYRMVNLYIRNAVGEYTAMMFFPIIASAIYGIYTQSADNWDLYKKNALMLTIGMVGLIVNHILSTEMVCFTLLVLCLFFIKKTLRKNTIRVYLLGMVQTVLLTFYFLIPFLDYYININVNINNTVDNVKRIQEKGVYLVQYFLFWQNVYNQLGTGVKERFQMTPGIVLMIALFLAIILWYKGKANYRIKVLATLSIGILILASDLFPWNFIAQYTIIGNILAQVQFPWRYLGIAIIFMTILVGELLMIGVEQKINIFGVPFSRYMVLGSICVVTVCSFSSSYCNGVGEANYFYDTAELDNKKIMNAEYLLLGTDRNLLSNEIISENMKSIRVINKVGNYMEIFCDVDEREGLVELPLYNYKGYQITDDKGMKYTILNGKNNNIAFKLPTGFSGKIKVQFVEPWYWEAATWISIISSIGLFVHKMRKRT